VKKGRKVQEHFSLRQGWSMSCPINNTSASLNVYCSHHKKPSYETHSCQTSVLVNVAESWNNAISSMGISVCVAFHDLSQSPALVTQHTTSRWCFSPGSQLPFFKTSETLVLTVFSYSSVVFNLAPLPVLSYASSSNTTSLERHVWWPRITSR